MASAEDSEMNGFEVGRNQFRRTNDTDLRRDHKSYNSDPLYLSSSDFPCMQPVNVKLNGSNFQKWSRAMKIALWTKTKLGFVDGSCVRLDVNSPHYNQWISVIIWSLVGY